LGAVHLGKSSWGILALEKLEGLSYVGVGMVEGVTFFVKWGISSAHALLGSSTLNRGCCQSVLFAWWGIL